MIAYHITKKDYVYSILEHGILPCDRIPSGAYSGHRGMSLPINKTHYESIYGFNPVFLTLDVKEAVERMGVRGQISEWCVIECDTDFSYGQFSFERLTKEVTPRQIRHIKCLSGWL